jgi:hypothetical protein
MGPGSSIAVNHNRAERLQWIVLTVLGLRLDWRWRCHWACPLLADALVHGEDARRSLAAFHHASSLPPARRSQKARTQATTGAPAPAKGKRKAGLSRRSG